MLSGKNKDNTIMEQFKKLLRIVLFVLIVGGILCTFFLIWKKSQPKKVVYEIAEVKRSDIDRISKFSGKLLPKDEIDVKSRISGIVDEIYVKSGDRVKENDPIARLKTIIDISRLQEAQSNVNMATITFENEKDLYDRQALLYNRGVISRSDLENSETAYKNAEEKLKNAAHHLNIEKQGYSDNTEYFHNNVIIRSLTEGQIFDVPVKIGDVIIPVNNFHMGTTIASVADMAHIEFVANIDETEIDRLYIGMPIKLKVRAMNNLEIETVLERIAHKGANKKGTIFFEIKAPVNLSGSERFFSNYRAIMEVSTAKKENVLVVPESALSFENDSVFVYVQNKQNKKKYIRKPITIGLSDKMNVEVVSGLEDGDRVRSVVIN